MTNELTTVILTNNRPEYLKQCIFSVVSQSRIPDRMVVAHSGTDAETKEIAKSFGLEYHGTEIEKDAKWNFERALQRVDTEYVHIMHDDDRLLQQFYETLLPNLQQHSAVTCSAHVINETGDRTGRILSVHGRVHDPESTALVYASGTAFVTPATIYKTRDLLNVGLKKYGLGKCDDVAVACNLKSIYNVKEALFEYRIHDQQDSSDAHDWKHQAKIALYLLRLRGNRIKKLNLLLWRTFQRISKWSKSDIIVWVSWALFIISLSILLYQIYCTYNFYSIKITPAVKSPMV